VAGLEILHRLNKSLKEAGHSIDWQIVKNLKKKMCLVAEQYNEVILEMNPDLDRKK